jgi:endoglucanase
MGRRFLQALVLGAVVVVSLIAGDGCRAEQQPWPLWNSYVKGFIDDQGRVIDHTGSDRTTSEAQAYAMFFALVANDRPHFDKLLRWTQANLAQGDLSERLPGWSWGKAPDGQWRVLDSNSASDADLWLTYDLLEAGRLWGVTSYSQLGKSLAERIQTQEVRQLPPSCANGPLLMPAPNGFHEDDLTWTMNPSYAPLPILQYLATTFPHGVWPAMVQELPNFLNHTATAGYAPDWSKCVAGQGWMPAAAPGAQPAPTAPGAAIAAAVMPAPVSVGSYDAIRVYLWLGIADPATPGLKESLESFPAMATYMSRQNVPPLTVDSYGSVKNGDGPLCMSAAVIPYLQAMGKTAEAGTQQRRLAASLDAGTGLYGNPPHYYDQNMALFANGWLEKRYRMDRDGRLKLKWK